LFHASCSNRSQIGNDNSIENPNVAIDNTKDLILKGRVVEGLSATEELLHTPVATEITEDYSPTTTSTADPISPACSAELFYENERLRKKISESPLAS